MTASVSFSHCFPDRLGCVRSELRRDAVERCRSFRRRPCRHASIEVKHRISSGETSTERLLDRVEHLRRRGGVGDIRRYRDGVAPGSGEPPRRPASPHPRTPRSSPRCASPTARPVAQLRRQCRDSRRSRASPDRRHSRLANRPPDRLAASQNRETLAEDVHRRHRGPEIGRTVDPHPRDAAPKRGLVRAEEIRPRSEMLLVHRQDSLPHLDAEQAANVVALCILGDAVHCLQAGLSAPGLEDTSRPSRAAAARQIEAVVARPAHGPAGDRSPATGNGAGTCMTLTVARATPGCAPEPGSPRTGSRPRGSPRPGW